MSIDTNLDRTKVTATIIQSNGVEFVDFVEIDLSKIYEPPMTTTNSVRTKTHDQAHINSLEQSLSNGIDYTQMPPVVYRENYTDLNGNIFLYHLVDGHHRLSALKRLGVTKWIFAVYKFGQDGVSFEDSLKTFQLKLNDHKPNLPSTTLDIVNAVSMLISHGSEFVKNDEDSIRDYINSTCKTLTHSKRGSIVKQIVARSGAYQHVTTYTAEKAYGWIKENTNYTYAGQYDSYTNSYGWTVLEGYEYEYLFNAAKKFYETDKESYFICHTKAPTKKNDLYQKRENMMKQFEYLESALIKVFEYYQENGQFPWHVEGFLPQDVDAGEDTLIPVV